MSLAFEEQRRTIDPNAPYQPYIPPPRPPRPGPSSEFAALRAAMKGSSKEMLEKGGDVLPYGAAVDRDGKIMMIVIQNIEGETRGHVLDNVIGNLVELAGPRGFRAVAFASSGHGMHPETGEQSRMILIHLEDAGGWTVMVPFSRGILPGTWVCGPVMEQEGEAVVYPALRGTR